MSKDKQIAVRMDSKTVALLERIGAERDLSVGWIVRQAVAEWLERHKPAK